MRLNEKINIAINYMQHAYTKYGRVWFSPTEIGEEINGGYSSVGSSVCKAMVERGLCERKDGGLYCLTTKGITEGKTSEEVIEEWVKNMRW